MTYILKLRQQATITLPPRRPSHSTVRLTDSDLGEEEMARNSSQMVLAGLYNVFHPLVHLGLEVKMLANSLGCLQLL